MERQERATTNRLLFALLGLGLPLLALAPPVLAGEPCCSITQIAGSLVTAQEAATGRTFQFRVEDPALAKSLRVGQKVHADFGTRQVSVDGAQPCCAIVAAAGGGTGAPTPPVHSAESGHNIQTPTLHGADPINSVKTPTVHGIEPCCNVVANAALKGRLGRLVVAFPDGAVPQGTRIAVLKDGQEVQSGYGNQSWDLLSGTYEVTVSGNSVPKVTVQAGHDTQVKVGVLRVSALQGTRVDVLDADKTLASGYGDQLIGLPPGSFDILVAGQTERIGIGAGQIVEF